MYRIMGGIEEVKNSDAGVIYADLLLEEIQYLCMKKNGNLYICTLRQQDEDFSEQNVRECSSTEARMFMANSFNKAMAIIAKEEGKND